MNGHTVKATAQEAILFDWALTLHNYDSADLDYLLQPDIQRLRYQAGRIIIRGKGEIDLLEEEVRWLLAILPATFRLGNKDVAFSLRKKLREALFGKKQRFGSFLAPLRRILSTRARWRNLSATRTNTRKAT